jgi:hypothetical protein
MEGKFIIHCQSLDVVNNFTSQGPKDVDEWILLVVIIDLLKKGFSRGANVVCEHPFELA